MCVTFLHQHLVGKGISESDIRYNINENIHSHNSKAVYTLPRVCSEGVSIAQQTRFCHNTLLRRVRCAPTWCSRTRPVFKIFVNRQ